VLILVAIGVLALNLGGPAFAWLSRLAEGAVIWLQAAPVALFYLGMALIPLLGLPVVPFYMAAGAAYDFPVSMVGIGLALLLNLTVSYWIARGLSGPVSRLLARAGWKIPQVPSSQYVQFTILVRLAPGAPLMVQNYILGLSGAPFLLYLAVSWPTEMLIATGYVLIGDSLYDRSWGILFAGVAFIIFVILLTQFLRSTLKTDAIPDIGKSE